MQVITTRNELVTVIDNFRKNGAIIGFVPTMGALHNGHVSLVKKCKRECDIAVASIFVNPTQFNDKEDLKRYPRTPDVDVELLKSVGCDVVFLPSVEEVYPEEDKRVFDFGALEKVMEGARRPGHFNGVAQVVSRLFDMVRPDKAFFGMKDFQQIAIIREMVRQLKYSIEIISCPIIREADGLAMSSRNKLLTPEHREAAPHIHAVLVEAQKRKASMSVAELKQWITDQINKSTLLDVEYVEIVDESTLQPISHWENHQAVVCVAVYAGEIRLIDNLLL